MHDPTKVLMGSTNSSDRVVDMHEADPATFPAGTCVRQKSDGTISVAKADGQLLGVSLGKSLSSTKKLSVCRAGLGVPVKLTDNGVLAALTINGDLTFTSVLLGELGNAITVTLEDTATAGSETVVVTDTDIVIGIEAGVSTATQIKAAFDLESDATDLATCTIVEGQGAAAQAAAAEDNLEGGVDSYDYVEKGAVVYIDDVTGIANIVDTGSVTTTAVNAVYVSEPLDCVLEDGTVSGKAAYIDMGGGL